MQRRLTIGCVADCDYWALDAAASEHAAASHHRVRGRRCIAGRAGQQHRTVFSGRMVVGLAVLRVACGRRCGTLVSTRAVACAEFAGHEATLPRDLHMQFMQRRHCVQRRLTIGFVAGCAVHAASVHAAASLYAAASHH